MPTVDSLDIQISAEVNKANASITTLSNRLDRLTASLSGVNSRGLAMLGAGVNKLANAMKNFSTNTKTADFSRLTKNLEMISKIDMSNISKASSQMSGLSKGISVVTNVAKGAEQSITKISDATKKISSAKISFNVSDYNEAIERLSTKFSESGKSFKVSGDFSQLEKQSQKLRAELDKLFQSEEKIISVGRISPDSTSFLNLQYNISKTANELDAVNEKIRQLKSATSDGSGIEIIRGDRAAISLEYLEKELQGIDSLMQRIVTKSQIETFISNLEDGLKRLQQSFPEQTQLIEEYKSKIESLKNTSIKIPEVNAKNSFNDIPEAAKCSVQEAQKTLNEALKNIHIEQPEESPFKNYTKEISDLQAKLKELEKTGLGMGSNEWDETYIALNKAKQAAKEYKAQLDNPSDGIDEDIKKTHSLGNKVEELRQRLKELKAQGLNIGDAKFDKTYTELNKTERELKEYKNTLSGAGRESTRFASVTLPNFNKVTNAIKKMGSNISSAVKKFGNIQIPLKTLSQGSDILTKKLGKLFIAFQSLRGAASLLGKSIDLSSDLTEVQNVIDVSFGKYKKSIEDFSKISISNYGMSELTAKEMAGRFQAMGVAVGFSQEKMADMSVELTKLAGDMASFYNVEQDAVAKSLESVFTGTTAPLRRYGLDLTQATLEEWAHKQGIDAKMKSMSNAEKVMLRYQYVLANTGAVEGDFLRTADSWANQVRVLKQSFEVLGTTVGGVLINVLKPFVKGLNTIMVYINDFAKTVSNALGKIFGWTYEEGGGITDDFSGAADGAGDLSDGMDDVADATDKATKKQKEFNKQLAKFDELNNYTFSEKGSKDKDDDKGSPSMSDLEGLGGASGGKWMQGESIVKKFESEIDSLYKLGEYIGDTLTEAMESIDWDSIYEKARGFGSGLAEFLNGLISPGLFSALGKTVAGGINTALNAALGFGENFNFPNFGSSIASFINSSLGGIDWDTALTAATTWGAGIAGALNSFIKKTDFDLIGSSVANFINTAVQGALSFVNNFKFAGVGKAIATALNSFIKKTDFASSGGLIAKFVNGVAKTALTTAKNFDFKGIGKAIATFINSALGNIQWKTILTAASSWGKGIAKAINSFFKQTDFNLIGSTVGNFINTAINFALSSGKELNFKEIGQKIADGINGAFKTLDFAGLAETINTWVKGALTTVVTLLQKTDFEMIGQKIGTFLAELDILSMMGKFAQMLWEAIKAGFSLLGGLIQEAPLETALIAAFAAFKFLGIGSAIGSAISSAISSALVTKLAEKLGVDLLADSSIPSVISTALSTKLAGPLQTVTDKIGAIAPAVGTAVGSFAEFNVVAGAFENLTTDIENSTGGVGDFIAEIGEIAGAVGIAATAFTAAMGFPAGVIIAAIAGVVGAIKGINDAFEEIKAEEVGNMIQEALTNPGGTPISDLTEKTSSDIEKIGNAFSSVNTKSQELESAKGNVNKLVFEIDKIKTSIEAGVISTEEGVEKLNDAYDSLATAINTKIGAAGDVLLEVFSSEGISSEAFEAAGLNSDKMKEKVVSSMDETQKEVFNLTEKLNKLRETDPTSDKIPELEQRLRNLATGTLETDKALDDLEVSLDTNRLNWKDYLNEDGFDTTKLQTGLDTMAKSVGTAKDTIKEDSGKILDAARNLSDEEVYSEIKSALPDTLEYMNTQVDSRVLETTDALQNDLIGGMNKIVDEAKTEWSKKNWFEKFFSGGSEASYVKSALEDYKKNYVEPATSQIESSLSEVGVEGAGWASDAMEDIIDSLFTTQVSRDFNQTKTVLKDDWQGIINGATKEVKGNAKNNGKEVGKSISDGVSDGIDYKKVAKAGEEVGNKTLKGTRKSLDSHSPSKAYKTIGGDVVDGFVLGLNTNWKKVENWWGKAKMPKVDFKVNDIKEEISKKWKEVTDWWGKSRELAVKADFKTTSNDVSEWWSKVEKWWGTKKLEVKNDFKTIKSNIDAWWKKITGWWGTKKLDVSNDFKTTKPEVDKWWSNKVKSWWGTKKLEVDSKFITDENKVKSWWTDKVKKWWGTREVKVSTDYTTKSDTVKGWGRNTVKWLKEGIAGAWGGFSEWVVKKIKSVINQVVKGLNWVLKQVGSDKTVPEWTGNKHAKGSSGLPKDEIGIVNDQAGSTYREMIIPPHGKPFIPKGRNVTLPMEKGTKIMPAKRTKEFINSIGNIPHFAKGTGKFTGNIFDYFDKPKEILKIAVDNHIDLSGLKGATLALSKGIKNTLIDGAESYIKKIFASLGSPGVESAINWAIAIANDDRHGYDQDRRWGPDYDCSSLIISAFEQAGIKLKSVGANATRNMYNEAKSVGFKDVTGAVNLGTGKGLQRGDILLAPGAHTELYIGNGQTVGAHINEKGTTKGGQTGDQTGHEIDVGPYRNHPYQYVLRYLGNVKSGGSTSKPDTPINYVPSAGVKQWTDVATKALQLTGQYSSENLMYLLEQMKHESNGNPYDVNTWDSNAKAGNPSKGLMQVTPTTFKMCAMKGYDKDIFDPLSNIIAGIRWALHAYGSLYKAWPARGYKGYATGIGTIRLSDIVKGYAKGGISKDETGIVNDQAGSTYKELIIPPHGTPFIPDGRNVMLSMQRGTRIIPANETKKMVKNLPHFADGTGSLSVNVQGIADGVKQAIEDTVMPYIKEIIRNLQGNSNSGTTVTASNKKTTTKYSDTVKEIQKAWTDLAKWFETTVAEPIEKTFEGMKANLLEVFDGTNKEMTTKYEEYSKEWQETLKKIPGSIKTDVNDEIARNFGELCTSLTTDLGTMWGNMQTALSPIPGWIESNITSSFHNKFTEIFGNIESEHSTMWSIMSSYADNKIDWITTMMEAAFTRFSYLISEFENRLGALDRGVSETEKAISSTEEKISKVKKQMEEVQATANSLNVNTGNSNTTKSNFIEEKIQSTSTSIAESFAEIPKKTSQFVQASAESTASRLEEAFKKRARFGRFKTGGFPEDGWFRASHGEIMGQFDNGQSVVANNQQITDGIADAVYPAVYNAVMAAMASSGGGGDVVVQIDGENVFKAVRNKDSDFRKRTGKGAFEY